jgi:hypothetical protein
VTGAAIAGGTQAYATPVRYDNPAGPEHFDWAVPGNTTWLDITLAPGDQPGIAFGASTFGHTPISGGADAGGTSGVTELEIINGYQMVGHPSDTLIPSGLGWNYYAYALLSSTDVPDGVATYLGVRFNGPNWQYGWIGIERSGAELDAFAWGFETEPGVPIPAGAPEPGTLAVLAVGAAGVLSRRRCGVRA